MEVGIELLSCPLCRFPHFKDVHSLRSTLINVATTQLSCPVCKEAVMGLDKLTIHLFSHMNVDLSRTENQPEHIPPGEVKHTQTPSISLDNSPDGKFELDIAQIDLKEAPTACDICNFTFTDRTILEFHQKLLHQTNPDKETGAYSFHCHLCSKKFKMRGSLIVHLRVAHYGFSHDNRTKKTIYEEGNLENCKTLPKTVDNKQWECDVCSKMFTTKYFLKKHKRLHTGEMPYCCTQCNKSFTFQQSYHKHMLYHSSEKPHTCSECGRSFKELSTLQNHARIHSGERPFACETCDKRFRQRVSYLVHRRIHTGVMPYDCKNCGKRFRYKVSQRSHKCVLGNSEQMDRNKTEEPVSSQFVHNADNIQANDVQCILSVDHEGKICFIRKKDDSIPIETEPGMNNSNKTIAEQLSSSDPKNRNIDNHIFGESNSSPDLYSMILSPLLPEVESLCLSPSTNDDNGHPNQQNYPENLSAEISGAHLPNQGCTKLTDKRQCYNDALKEMNRLRNMSSEN